MNLRSLIILLIVGGILFLVFATPMLPFVVSGYGGLSSRVNAIEYVPNPDSPHIVYDISETVGIFQPNTLGGLGMCDLKLELGQPQFTGTEQTYFNEISETLENGDQLERTWEVRIAYFEMGFTIRTSGEGAFAASDVDFWIEIQENQFNVFEGADDVRAYILEIVTLEPLASSDLSMFEGSPSAGGFSFDMDPLSTGSLPDWMSDSGYQDTLSDLEHVRFKVHVDWAKPWVFPGLVRAEHQGTWKVEIRALTFGFWEVLSPYDGWVPGEVWEGWFPWLDDLFLGLQLIIGAIFGLIVTVAVVKIPIPPCVKVVALGIVWIGIFVIFGGVALVG